MKRKAVLGMMLTLILIGMLTLTFNVIPVFADEWVPYVPNPDQVDLMFWIENETAYMKVCVTFMHSGYEVSDWGYVVKDGHEIWADSEIWEWTGTTLPVIITLCNTYNLGKLEDGTYTFTFKAWGLSVKSISFIVATPLPRTWTVDDDGPADFSRIQDAISSLLVVEGDTIYVHNGTYYENVVVNKNDLTLVGENRTTTIIDGNGIYITASNIVFRGFTTRVSGLWAVNILLNETVDTNITNNNIIGGSAFESGIQVYSSINVALTGNNVTGSGPGIVLSNSSHVVVSENNIECPLGAGVGLRESFNNTVTRNNLTKVGASAIGLSESFNNTIVGNNVTGWAPQGEEYGGAGINIQAYPGEIGSSYNTFCDNEIKNTYYAVLSDLYIGGHCNNVFLRNNIANNYYGVYLQNSFNFTFKDNTLSENVYGMVLRYSNTNKIFHNSFINNVEQVQSWESVNPWDDGYPAGGNHWSNYTDADLYCGPKQDILGSDGIWDHPYVVDPSNKDNFPLVNPYISGNLTVSIYTDKYTYHAGDVMKLGLDVTNHDSVKYLCFAIWLELPNGSKHLYMHKHSVLLAIGLSYTNPSFRKITLPSLPKGIYTWHAAFLERTTHTIIVEDTAQWEFV